MESQSALAWKGPLEVLQLITAKAVLIRSACPVKSWTPPTVEVPQPLCTKSCSFSRDFVYGIKGLFDKERHHTPCVRCTVWWAAKRDLPSGTLTRRELSSPSSWEYRAWRTYFFRFLPKDLILERMPCNMGGCIKCSLLPAFPSVLLCCADLQLSAVFCLQLCKS